ncbi:MAG: hypothetical protein ACI4WG_01145 [Erysipelotrichaceae bacterium]
MKIVKLILSFILIGLLFVPYASVSYFSQEIYLSFIDKKVFSLMVVITAIYILLSIFINKKNYFNNYISIGLLFVSLIVWYETCKSSYITNFVDSAGNIVAQAVMTNKKYLIAIGLVAMLIVLIIDIAFDKRKVNNISK